MFDYVEHIWIISKSNLISNSILILWGVANSVQIYMHELKGSAFLNWQFTFQKYGNYDFSFHRHSRNESNAGLLSLLVVAPGQRDCLIYHWYNWPQREPSLLWLLISLITVCLFVSNCTIVLLTCVSPGRNFVFVCLCAISYCERMLVAWRCDFYIL